MKNLVTNGEIFWSGCMKESLERIAHSIQFNNYYDRDEGIVNHWIGSPKEWKPLHSDIDRNSNISLILRLNHMREL